MHLVPKGCLLIAWLLRTRVFAFLVPWAVIIGVTQKGALSPIWHSDFWDCCQKTPLYHLAQMASRAYAYGST